MTVAELCARFPEIPEDLRGEPAVARFAVVFDGLLRAARSPSPCSRQHDAANHYYLQLVGPFSILGYGLATRAQTLAEVESLLARHAADPEGFAASLVPAGTAEREVRGPGCEGA